MIVQIRSLKCIFIKVNKTAPYICLSQERAAQCCPQSSCFDFESSFFRDFNTKYVNFLIGRLIVY